MGNSPELSKRVAALLKHQKGKCAHCSLFFRENDVIEVDHRIPKSAEIEGSCHQVQPVAETYALQPFYWLKLSSFLDSNF